MSPTTTDVAIVGAGIWGLAADHFLQRLAPHAQVRLFEAGLRAGGAISTIRQGDFLFEPGPNSLLDNSPELRRLLDDTGLAAQVVAARPEAAKNRFIVRGGRLRPLPMSPPGLLTSDLFSLGAKLPGNGSHIKVSLRIHDVRDATGNQTGSVPEIGQTTLMSISPTPSTPPTR